MANNRTGSVLSSDPRAAAQAAAIGATIGGDGWWYKDGKRLKPADADALVNASGAGISGLSDEGHGKPGGFRIGGDVGGLWERNKNDIAKYGGVAANFIPGVGPLAAAGISAALNYAAHKDPLKAALAGATSYGAGNIGKAIGKIPGAQSVQDVLAKIPGAGAIQKFGGAVKDLIPQGKLPGAQSVQDLLAQAAGGLGGAAQGAGQWLGGDGGMNALGLAQGVNAAALGQKSNNFADMAAKNVDELWKQKAPLRVAGIAGMLNPKTEDTSALQRISARGNPFSDRPQPMGGY